RQKAAEKRKMEFEIEQREEERMRKELTFRKAKPSEVFVKKEEPPRPMNRYEMMLAGFSKWRDERRSQRAKRSDEESLMREEDERRQAILALAKQKEKAVPKDKELFVPSKKTSMMIDEDMSAEAEKVEMLAEKMVDFEQIGVLKPRQKEKGISDYKPATAQHRIATAVKLEKTVSPAVVAVEKDRQAIEKHGFRVKRVMPKYETIPEEKARKISEQEERVDHDFEDIPVKIELMPIKKGKDAAVEVAGRTDRTARGEIDFEKEDKLYTGLELKSLIDSVKQRLARPARESRQREAVRDAAHFKKMTKSQVLSEMKKAHDSEPVVETQKEKTEARLKRFQKLLALKRETAGDILRRKQEREDNEATSAVEKQAAQARRSFKRTFADRLFEAVTVNKHRKKERMLKDMYEVYGGGRGEEISNIERAPEVSRKLGRKQEKKSKIERKQIIKQITKQLTKKDGVTKKDGAVKDAPKMPKKLHPKRYEVLLHHAKNIKNIVKKKTNKKEHMINNLKEVYER
ncbi:MAG: hypothetical protein KJ574_00895, partial [Nanoarchaeota archaeon]|nr:hypothetical protein [Nanoarchaeota archaeon]